MLQSLTIIETCMHIGRYDIARALEKWGGLHEVSRLLSLKVRHPNRQRSLAKENKLETTIADDHDNTSSAVSHKWLLKLNDFDINWVE